MTLSVNNNRKVEVKDLMDKTLACVKDLSISFQDRKDYYSFYTSLLTEYYLLCKG